MSFTGALPPPSFNLARACFATGALTPEKTALIIDDGRSRQRLSYGQLIDAVKRLRGGFATLNLAPASRVFLRMGNSLDYALAFFAANAAGLAPIPASAQLTAEEAAFLIADSGAAIVVADGTLPLLPSDCPVIGPDEFARLKRYEPADFTVTAAEAPGYMVYTSGTSGRPKGVLHAQRALLGRRPMYDGWTGITAADRVLHTGAFNWTYTLGVGLFDPFAAGATAIVYTGPRDDGVWSSLAAKEQATILASVPGLFRQMLKRDAIPRHAAFRHALTAGEAIGSSTAAQWEEATGGPIYESLGMSELSTYISSGPATPRRAGRVGRAQPGRHVVILPTDSGTTPLPAGETGLIAVHASDPGLMLGYWNRPDDDAAVRRGDWFIGGDLGRMDADGYITHAGRNDDVMNAMGYRVSPAEVEDVLAHVPGVTEVAVTDVAVSNHARQIAAFVIGAAPVAALEAAAAAHLAPYKRPRLWRFVDSLPRTGNGKVLRRVLRDEFIPDRISP